MCADERETRAQMIRLPFGRDSRPDLGTKAAKFRLVAPGHVKLEVSKASKADGLEKTSGSKVYGRLMCSFHLPLWGKQRPVDVEASHPRPRRPFWLQKAPRTSCSGHFDPTLEPTGAKPHQRCHTQPIAKLWGSGGC